MVAAEQCASRAADGMNSVERHGRSFGRDALVRALLAASVGVTALAGVGAVEPAPTAAATVIPRLDVVVFRQDDPLWGSDRLGSSRPPVPLSTAGCAVTSLAMVLAYAGVSIVTPKGDGMDPGILNQWLGPKANSVTWSNVDVPPGAGGSIWRRNYAAWTAHYPSGFRSARSYIDSGKSDDIMSELAAGRPVIAWVTSPEKQSHFVVITGFSGNDFYINDPGGMSATLFAHYRLLGYRTYRPKSATVTIDDTSAGFSTKGSMTKVRDSSPPRLGYAGQMRYSSGLAGADDPSSATWKATLPSPGVWDLYVYVPDHHASPAATYEIQYRDRTIPITIPQIDHVREWVEVGNGYYLPNGGLVSVTLSNITGVAGGVLAFDAVKWVK